MRSVAALAGVLALGCSASAASARGTCVGTDVLPTAANIASVNAATLCLLNRARGAAHLRPLRFNRPLEVVAAGQAHDMVAGDYFGDNSLTGQTPLQRIVAVRYAEHTKRFHTAQNIGWGTGGFATPAGIVASWMASAPHRRIILTAGFRDVGIGVTPAAPSAFAEGQQGATYTIELGRRVFSARSAARH